MKCILIGSGGREHALAWSIAGSALTNELIIAPNSAAMASLGTCVDVAADDDGLLALANRIQPDRCGRAGSPACGWAGWWTGWKRRPRCLWAQHDSGTA